MTRTIKCPDHDPNSGPGSDWCPNCRRYVEWPAWLTRRTEMRRDTTPEWVKRARANALPYKTYA